jgi:DNA recombination protein RmuC
MLKMDDVLERLLKQAGTFTTTIERARTRTRAVGRKLKDVGLMDQAAAEQMLELAADNEDVAAEE